MISIIKKVSILLALLWIINANAAFAGFEYSVDSNNSVVMFSVVTKQYIVEPAVFRNIGGSISKLGYIEIDIDVSSIDTHIPLRDKRLKHVFFKIEEFPMAHIMTKIDMNKLESIPHYKQMEISATLEFYGNSKEVKLNILVARICENKLLIVSMEPFIVDASDFGVPASNMIELSKRAGNIEISDEVAVTFVLSFKKDM